MVKTPQATLKIKNKTDILQEILVHGITSKTDLSKKLKSTKTTTSKHVNELIEDNLILEIGKGTNSLGKKSTLLDINPNLFHFMAIDLSGNEFNLKICNLKDNILYYKKLPLPNINDIHNILYTSIEKCSSLNLITTIVISIPAVVKENSIISNNKIYVDIHKKINSFAINENMKLIVHNNIDLQAEYLFAKYLKFKKSNFILIGANFGIGSSIFYNNKLLNSPNKFAGEIAFTNPKIVNNKIENLESRCSIHGIQQKYYAKNNIQLSKEDILNKIKENDVFLNSIIDDIIDELSVTIHNIIYILDIKDIYLSGYLFTLRDDMVSSIYNKLLTFCNKEANIEYIPLQNKSIEGSSLIINREVLKLI